MDLDVWHWTPEILEVLENRLKEKRKCLQCEQYKEPKGNFVDS